MKSLKGFIVFNLVMNIPLAITMTLTATLLVGEPILSFHTLYMIILGFVLATIVNTCIPVQRISAWFAKLLNKDPETPAGKVLGNIPVCGIFVIVIGLIMAVVNVKVFPIFIFAFLATFIPMYIACFIVSIIFAPIALKVAGKMA